MFLGKSEDALRYFTSIGYTMPALTNPADFFMDVVRRSLLLFHALSFLYHVENFAAFSAVPYIHAFDTDYFIRKIKIAGKHDRAAGEVRGGAGGGGENDEVVASGDGEQLRSEASSSFRNSSVLFWPGSRRKMNARLSSAPAPASPTASGGLDLFENWSQRKSAWRQIPNASSLNAKPISPAAYSLLSPAGFFRALFVNMKRSAIQHTRALSNNIFDICLHFLTGYLLGSVYGEVTLSTVAATLLFYSLGVSPVAL